MLFRSTEDVSYRRRILHGKIDILRAELVSRLRRKDESGELLISGADVQRLTDILTGNFPGPDELPADLSGDQASSAD